MRRFLAPPSCRLGVDDGAAPTVVTGPAGVAAALAAVRERGVVLDQAEYRLTVVRSDRLEVLTGRFDVIIIDAVAAGARIRQLLFVLPSDQPAESGRLLINPATTDDLAVVLELINDHDHDRSGVAQRTLARGSQLLTYAIFRLPPLPQVSGGYAVPRLVA